MLLKMRAVMIAEVAEGVPDMVFVVVREYKKKAVNSI